MPDCISLQCVCRGAAVAVAHSSLTPGGGDISTGHRAGDQVNFKIRVLVGDLSSRNFFKI